VRSEARRETTTLIGGLLALAAVTFGYVRILAISNAATVSTTFLLIVLVVAALSTLRVAAATSVTAVLAFNFFFLPPVGTFTIADPQNWVALAAFLAVSIIASNLSAQARARAQEAIVRRDEMTRLFDLSRDVLMMTATTEGLVQVARTIARRFDLAFVALAVPERGEWRIFESGAQSVVLDRQELGSAMAAAQARIEFDAYQRSYTGHREVMTSEGPVRLVPLRAGTTPIGMLAAAGRPVEAGTLDALAGVAAIAIERARFLEERKAAELTRQSEELKTALLATLGHDLRTPLTAIRVAATNLRSPAFTPDQQREQVDLILEESGRLSRVFEEILEMARIDAGAVATEVRWAHPSEIVTAAREQVARVLGRHTIDVVIGIDTPVRLDPRLTASALAHVLENAAQYASADSMITITATVNDDGLTISVRDRGPGIASADLPRLFERFYRGSTAKAHTAGTGMGLSIARGLLAAEGGRIWGDNHPDGGAEFTMVVPADAKVLS
jgi:two-component system sensor histidine kinase KdpD